MRRLLSVFVVLLGFSNGALWIQAERVQGCLPCQYQSCTWAVDVEENTSGIFNPAANPCVRINIQFPQTEPQNGCYSAGSPGSVGEGGGWQWACWEVQACDMEWWSFKYILENHPDDPQDPCYAIPTGINGYGIYSAWILFDYAEVGVSDEALVNHWTIPTGHFNWYYDDMPTLEVYPPTVFADGFINAIYQDAQGSSVPWLRDLGSMRVDARGVCSHVPWTPW